MYRLRVHGTCHRKDRFRHHLYDYMIVASSNLCREYGSRWAPSLEP